jgi:uncharacterized protein
MSALEDRLFDAAGEDIDALEALLAEVEAIASAARYFQQPGILRWIATLQDDLAASGLVGKSNALPDLVKTVNRELVGGDRKISASPTASRASPRRCCSSSPRTAHRTCGTW